MTYDYVSIVNCGDALDDIIQVTLYCLFGVQQGGKLLKLSFVLEIVSVIISTGPIDIEYTGEYRYIDV